MHIVFIHSFIHSLIPSIDIQTLYAWIDEALTYCSKVGISTVLLKGPEWRADVQQLRTVCYACEFLSL